MKASLRSLSKPVHALPSCTNSIKHAPPPPPLPPSHPPGSERTLPLPRTQHFTHASGRTDSHTNEQTCHFPTEISRSAKVVVFFFWFQLGSTHQQSAFGKKDDNLLESNVVVYFHVGATEAHTCHCFCLCCNMQPSMQTELLAQYHDGGQRQLHQVNLAC